MLPTLAWPPHDQEEPEVLAVDQAVAVEIRGGVEGVSGQKELAEIGVADDAVPPSKSAGQIGTHSSGRPSRSESREMPAAMSHSSSWRFLLQSKSGGATSSPARMIHSPATPRLWRAVTLPWVLPRPMWERPSKTMSSITAGDRGSTRATGAAMRNEVPTGPISMGLLEAQSRHGWTNYSLFLRDDGLLIGCVETPDGEAALAVMADVPVNSGGGRR